MRSIHETLSIVGLTAAILQLLLVNPTTAQSINYTVPGHFACYQLDDLEEIQGFGSEMNREALTARLQDNRCFLFRSYTPVFVLEKSWSKVRIRPLDSGREMWTVIGGIEAAPP